MNQIKETTLKEDERMSRITGLLTLHRNRTKGETPILMERTGQIECFRCDMSSGLTPAILLVLMDAMNRICNLPLLQNRPYDDIIIDTVMTQTRDQYTIQ